MSMEKKRIAGEKAAEFIKDGMILGLGTGSTAFYMINKVGELVQNGMHITAVATSRSTEILAKKLGITVINIDEVASIDLAIDGVDAIDHCFNAVKGGGGALFREKIVASMAKDVIWIMDDSKLVDDIGICPLPVEVLPYGYTQILRQLEEYGFHPQIRQKNGAKYVTDNGNYIIDLHIGSPMDITDVGVKLNSIVGVLETGLFINMCTRMIVGTESGAVVYEYDRVKYQFV